MPVVLTAAAGASIRYTTNGIDPTTSSPLYTAPVVLQTSTTLKAKAFQPDWTASPTLTAAYTIQAAAPSASPSPGTFDAPQLVALMTTTSGAEIRFTRDGSEPTTSSELYAAPFLVGTTTTVKARAYRSGCDPSPTMVATFEIVDTTPPTITAQVDPPANAAGWHNTAVTVTFTCVDSGLPAASCTSPVSVQQDGRDIKVTGEAVDAAGNRSTLDVFLDIDRVAPKLTVFAPRDGEYVSPGTTVATIRGNAFDSVSDIQAVSCAGVSALLSGQQYSCDVPVVPGANPITVEAQNLAGSSTARQLTLHVGDPPAPTAITVTPSRLTVFAGETREVRVTDQDGRTMPPKPGRRSSLDFCSANQ